MKAIKYLVSLTISYLAVFLLSVPVYADVLSDRIGEVSAASDETTLVSAILRLALPIAGFALIGLLMYAGFMMLTSQGNPEKLSEAREIVTNAVLGFALIGLSVAVLLLIQNVLQIPGIN